MRPAVLILESRREVAEAMHALLATARYVPIVRQHLDRLSDLDEMPAAIVVRITSPHVGEPAHAALTRLPVNRPPIVAIAWTDQEVAEARRLKCDVVLRAPKEVARLCDALANVMVIA